MRHCTPPRRLLGASSELLGTDFLDRVVNPKIKPEFFCIHRPEDSLPQVLDRPAQHVMGDCGQVLPQLLPVLRVHHSPVMSKISRCIRPRTDPRIAHPKPLNPKPWWTLAAAMLPFRALREQLYGVRGCFLTGGLEEPLLALVLPSPIPWWLQYASFRVGGVYSAAVCFQECLNE